MQEATLANVRTRANNLLATAAPFISFSADVGMINITGVASTIVAYSTPWKPSRRWGRRRHRYALAHPGSGRSLNPTLFSPGAQISTLRLFRRLICVNNGLTDASSSTDRVTIFDGPRTNSGIRGIRSRLFRRLRRLFRRLR
jgi:hypothetical protein